MFNRSLQDNQNQATEGNAASFRAPSISLPKGGGAIRGIGEKFAANPVAGTGSMTVPIAISPGRSGVGPQLSLSYDSGAGNGPFGFGWSLSLPAITRKTDKGLPRYRDIDESDVFVLSGAEDLVPVLVETAGQWQRETLPPRLIAGETYRIQRYRPRIEGLFARIERWTNENDPGDSFWRSISKDNVTTWYGKSVESRITDPADGARVFSWLICESYDDKGNVIVYQYRPENSDGVDETQVHERNRNDLSRSANRYLKRIRYGNHTPYFPELLDTEPWPAPLGATASDAGANWFFEVVLDYGEHDPATPLPQDPGTQWPVRNDPFSTYRAGFEVRTYRLCQRVLMFHHFSGEEGIGQDCLVRSTDFFYSDERDPADPRNPIYSFLLSVTQSGYKRRGTGYLSKSLPPLEFEYTQPNVDPTVREIDSESLENLPYGLDTSRYQWADLDGEGLSGILTEEAGSWFYKRNLSPVTTRTERDREVVIARLAPIERVMQQPSPAAMSNGRQLLDLAGDGQLDLVELDGPTPGFFERAPEESWEPFTPFSSLPVLDWNDPNLKFVDLTGDGHADILITEDDALCWHPSLAEAGFGPPERVRQSLDEEDGPKLIFADGTQIIHLADLSGDGLTDLVRIRNGEVCYWPNLGYGRFGAKVTMDNAPWFDAPELFDGRRIRLADIDGTGTTDIIYLGSDGVQIYFNQSGNRWGGQHTLDSFPRIDNLSAVTALDLLSNGTACLIWSSPLPGDARQPMRYIDLMGGEKPHLLVKSVNNLGAETRVRYAPSTKFYLAHELAGTPWITRIPFPVHVVERIETHDHVSHNRFVTRYAYHHGYFDGVEREFRGFGRVDQWDTEEIAALTADGTLPDATNIDIASHVPPVWTKTWFHTGVHLGRDRVSNFFAGLLDANQGEYYREPGVSDPEARQRLLDDTVLPNGLTIEEEREACRALKGTMLRQEVYALDGTEKALHPYTVTEQSFTIKPLQPKEGNRHAVFFTHAREAIHYHYERDPDDSRVSHALTLEVDRFGDVLKSGAVGYGRRASDLTEPFDQDRQTRSLITYTESDFTNSIDELDVYRTPLPSEARTYELTGYRAPTGQQRFTFSDFVRDNGAHLEHIFDSELSYEEAPTAGRQRRLIEHIRTLYRRDDLTGLLPLGAAMSMALAGESYKLAFTPGLLNQVYLRGTENLLPADPAGILAGQGADRGGYVASQILRGQVLFPGPTEPRFTRTDGDNHWWIPSGKVFFEINTDVTNPGNTAVQELAEARRHFFLPRKFVDPFNQATTVNHDGHDLLARETQDAVGNTVTAQHDYRVLQPRLMTDPNGNRSEVAFDGLGMVAGTAVMGKTTETFGDTLSGFEADLTDTEVDGFYDVDDPHVPAPTLLEAATTRVIYDLDRFKRTRDAHPRDPSQWLPVYAATLARETHASEPVSPSGLKIQISFSYSDGFGREIQRKIQAEPGPLIAGGPVVSPRWVGSGWTVFNNKGKPVRQYEPFFSRLSEKRHRFEFGVESGVSPVLFYDPVERVVATLQPNHTYEKVVFDPWRQTTYDANDTGAPNGTETGDPRTDEDIKGYVAAYFKTQPASWQTWHAQRIGNQMGAAERDAAQKAAAHANTPTIAHFDMLGRPFLTIAHNRRFERDSAVIEERYRTRVELDIEGNQRAVRDAIVQTGDLLGRIVVRDDYDMLGTPIHSASMEAGDRWMLNDVSGKPIRSWDSRGHVFRTEYDDLRRPVRSFVQGSDPENPAAEILFERTEYGEGQPNDRALNLRTRVFRQFDGAGVVTNMGHNPVTDMDEAYDFTGNLLRRQRQLAADHKTTPDWSGDPALEAEVFISSATYDALNRPVTLTTPDDSIVRPIYNEANLERVEANLRGSVTATEFVRNIDYNAKGQRELIEYGNGARTEYRYDPDTFRLTRLTSTRTGFAPDERTVQDLSYVYDPSGNITHIQDDGDIQNVVFFRNRRVEASNDYTYDAVYRLIEATGREHLGQTGNGTLPPVPTSYNDRPRIGLLHPGDGNAMGGYLEQYVYDEVGNILEMIHRGSDPAHPGWRRSYVYNDRSLLQADKHSNRLSRTIIGANGAQPQNEDYSHDAHGNMTGMPHLQIMQWDFQDRLQMTQRQAVNAQDEEDQARQGERTFYVYDAAGQRVRKVTELATGQVKDERLYLGGFEIYRRHGSSALARETLHIMDDQQRIALVETRTQGDDGSPAQLIRHQLGNHLGSACLELDAEAAVISYEEYHPYGSTAYQAGRSIVEVSLKRYRYTGKERDEETGLNYHGARYYAPWLGRWTAADPIDVGGGINFYTYAETNPEALFDPNGQKPIPAWQQAANAELEARLKGGETLTRDDQIEAFERHSPTSPKKTRASVIAPRDTYGIEIEARQKHQREARQSQRERDRKVIASLSENRVAQSKQTAPLFIGAGVAIATGGLAAWAAGVAGLGAVATGVVSGALGGGAGEATTAALEGADASEIAERTAKGTFFGGLFGGLLGKISSLSAASRTDRLINAPRFQPGPKASPVANVKGTTGEAIVNEMNNIPTLPEHTLPEIRSITGASIRRLDAPIIDNTRIQVKNVENLSRRDLSQIVDTIFDALRSPGKVELYLPSRTRLYMTRRSEELGAFQEVIQQAETNEVLTVFRVPFF